MEDRESSPGASKRQSGTVRHRLRPPCGIQTPANPPDGYVDFAEYARAEIPPALRERFDALLLTYHIRELRGEVAIPRIDDRLKNWQLECEAAYGDGHYPARKQIMYMTLGKVLSIRHADPGAIHAALADVRKAAMDAARGGRSIDWRRKLVEDHAKLRDNVEYWARRLQRWFREAEQADLGLSAGRGDVPEVVRHLNALLEALSTDPFAKAPPSGSARRRRPSFKLQPWLEKAHQDLAGAGVRRQADRESLLTAVGLIPHPEHLLG